MTTEKPDASKADADAAHKEAFQYWGYLIKGDKCGTGTFDRLLKGIAAVISTKFEPHDCPDLTPSQLAAFYRAVGGNYDVLFIDTPASSISFIYRSLGAFHSLQPAPGDDGYSHPTIPALKAKGFVTWQTIQLLLGPEEHVPFLQRAVELFDVKDPETGDVFPKILPKECFPEKPDDAMEQWYESVAERLKREAEVETTDKPESTRVRVEVDDAGPRTSSEASDNERYGAATYFSDPLYRKSRTRPGYTRHFSRQPVYGDRGVVGRVRHMLNPFHSRERRRDSPAKYPDDDYSDVDATPIATVPPPHPSSHHHRYPASTPKRTHAPRRDGSFSSTDSDSEAVRPSPRCRSPVLRQRRSHDPPTSPREYFPAFYDERDRSYSQDTTPEHRRKESHGPPPPIYGPTKSPLFATHVAQLQAHNYVYDRRPSAVPVQSPYRPQNVRYTVKPVDPEAPYARERARDRDREREPRRMDEYDSPSSRSSRRREHTRRRSDEYPHPRDRERSDAARTRSHDRVKDEWDSREASRDRDRERDDRVRARYVANVGGVQDGVGGRRYPVEQPWR